MALLAELELFSSLGCVLENRDILRSKLLHRERSYILRLGSVDKSLFGLFSRTDLYKPSFMPDRFCLFLFACLNGFGSRPYADDLAFVVKLICVIPVIHVNTYVPCTSEGLYYLHTLYSLFFMYILWQIGIKTASRLILPPSH